VLRSHLGLFEAGRGFLKIESTNNLLLALEPFRVVGETDMADAVTPLLIDEGRGVGFAVGREVIVEVIID